MEIDCPWCGEDTGYILTWNPRNEKELQYGYDLVCPHCEKEIETDWETGYYCDEIDDYSDGYGVVRRKFDNDFSDFYLS